MTLVAKQVHHKRLQSLAVWNVCGNGVKRSHNHACREMRLRRY